MYLYFFFSYVDEFDMFVCIIDINFVFCVVILEFYVFRILVGFFDVF